MGTGQSEVLFESMEARRLFADVLFDAAGLSATQSVTVNGIAYFFADDGVTGRELWKSDGTGEGTSLVKDLTPGAASTELHSLFHANDRAVIITVVPTPASLEPDAYTLWSSDGTEAGTVKLAELTTVGEGIQPQQVGEQVGFGIYRASSLPGDGLYDALIYFTDGTVGGSRVVEEFLATAERPITINWIRSAGGRLFFPLTDSELWASDGTSAGTVNLTPTIFGSQRVDPEDMIHVITGGDKLLVPNSAAQKLWVSDGSIAGTVAHDLNIGPNNQALGAAYVDGTYYVTIKERYTNPPRYTLRALDLDNDQLTTLLTLAGDGGSHVTSVTPAADGVLFSDRDLADRTGSLWTSDGTTGGTAKLATFTDSPHILTKVFIDGAVYFTVGSGAYIPDVVVTDTATLGWIGERGPDGKMRDVTQRNAADVVRIELWRSDGTADGTGVVRTLWEAPVTGKVILTTLTEANGKLVVRTEVSNVINVNAPFNPGGLANVSDETVLYDPEELSRLRSGASVKVVNGVLRLGGSTGADSFRLYLNPGDADELIVEYNGYTRVFALNAIRRIVADLQAGNDSFEIVENTPGEFRLWTSVMGGDGADTIIAGTGRDTILGGAGNDFIRSRGNKDQVDGGGGRDRITGGEGDDVLLGGAGRDLLLANSGHDVLFGQSAIDRAFDLLWEDGDAEEDVVLPSL